MAQTKSKLSFFCNSQVNYLFRFYKQVLGASSIIQYISSILHNKHHQNYLHFKVKIYKYGCFFTCNLLNCIYILSLLCTGCNSLGQSMENSPSLSDFKPPLGGHSRTTQTRRQGGSQQKVNALCPSKFGKKIRFYRKHFIPLCTEFALNLIFIESLK